LVAVFFAAVFFAAADFAGSAAGLPAVAFAAVFFAAALLVAEAVAVAREVAGCDSSMRCRLVQGHVDPLMVQRTKDRFHPFGADLGLHQRNPKLLAVDRTVSLADPYQILERGVGKLGWHLGGGNYRRQGWNVRHSRHRLPFVARQLHRVGSVAAAEA
jgi:hypothetical protein